MSVQLSEVDRGVGHAVFESVIGSQRWIHRKVETLHMLNDDAGRRKVSIDCTPPADTRLLVPSSHRATDRQAYLPIAILSKVQIRDIDISSADGQTIPMAERAAFEWLEISALVAEIEQKGNSISDELIADLNHLVREKADVARTVAAAILGGERAYDGFDVQTLPQSLRRFISDLAEGFLLVIVVDEHDLGRRRVFKYSTYWPQPDPQRYSVARPLESVRDALAMYLRRVGWFPFHYHIDVSGAAFAASYHIQVHIPEGLAYDRMELPRTEGSSARVDIESGSIAHGGAHFDASAVEDAVLVLRNPSNGRLGSVLSIGLLTVAIMTAFVFTGLGALVSRNAYSVEDTLGLLLLLPAGLIALAARNRDNAVAAAASLALRVTAFILAACYIAVAVTLVLIGDEREYRAELHVVFLVVWVVAVVVTVPILVGWLRTRAREEHYRSSPDPDEYADYHEAKPKAGRFGRRIGVEHSVFRVATVESGLTVLGATPALSARDLAVAAAEGRSVTERVIADYLRHPARGGDAQQRDALIRTLARDAMVERSAALQLPTARESVFADRFDDAAELFIGHVKGRRVLPASATTDHAVGIVLPAGAAVAPPTQWMTVLVVRGDVTGHADPRMPTAQLLLDLFDRFDLADHTDFSVVVPEGALNDRVRRLVHEFGAPTQIPERAAIYSAVDVMTGASGAHVLYGTVGAVEGMAIAAAAQVLGAEMHGSFGSPDLLFASGGIGRHSGFYRASELINTRTLSMVVAAPGETDLLDGGMSYMSRTVSDDHLSVVLGGEGFSDEVVSGARAATEAAAEAARRWFGKKDKNAADAAAVAAMRDVLNRTPFSGVVVIGEGEKDRAPMLANGEHLGVGGAPSVDVAVDPLDGTRLVGEGVPGSICVLALAPRGSMYDPRDVYYMDKLIADANGIGVLDIRRPIEENLRALAAAKGVPIGQLTAVVLDKPRHVDLISRIRATGATVRAVGEGDVSAAVLAATSGSGVDLVVGVGGTPEGIVAACAVRALGGFMEGRLAPQSQDQRAMALAAGHDLDRIFTAADLVRDDRVLFVSSQVN